MSNPLRILDEQVLELEEVGELLRISLATVYRYCHHGLDHLHTGPKRGGKILTSRQAVEHYLAKMNDLVLDEVEATSAAPPTSAGRRRYLAGVDRDLDKVGI